MIKQNFFLALGLEYRTMRPKYIHPYCTQYNMGLYGQILSGLITYLLLAIYCQQQHGDRVSIQTGQATANPNPRMNCMPN